MRRASLLAIILAVIGPLSILATPAAAAAAAGPTSVTVPSSAQWVNTGVQVTTSDHLQIQGTGSWFAGSPMPTFVGPDGTSYQWGDNYLNTANIGSQNWDFQNSPTSGWGALIGYIGNDAPPGPGSYWYGPTSYILPFASKMFVVGSHYSGMANGTGTLWLAFNDDAYSGNTADNSGSVTANIIILTPNTVAYYALGDSVASGYGLAPSTGFPCERSTAAYPHNVLNWLKTRLTTVNFTMLACSGATTGTADRNIQACANSPQAANNAIKQHNCTYLSLQNQIKDAANEIKQAPTVPTLVTITVGIDDSGWANCQILNLDMCVPKTWLTEADSAFQTDVNNTSATVESNLRQELNQLLVYPNVTIVLTDYYDPMNSGSYAFPALLAGFPVAEWEFIIKYPTLAALLGIHIPTPGFNSCLFHLPQDAQNYQMSCYQRADDGLVTLNKIYPDLASQFPGRVYVAKLHDQFQAHAAPQWYCGTASPSASQSWIQYPFLSKGSGYSPTGLYSYGNDCFHPNATGARQIAGIVEGVLQQQAGY